MKISIIGSEGYIGTALQPYLKHHEVQRIDACLYGQAMAGVNVVPMFKNQENRYAIADYIEHFNPAVVVNLAALAHDPEGRLDSRLVHAVNHIMPTFLGGTAVHQKRRYIAISSLSVHGEGAYPSSKRLMEEGLSGFGLYRGIDILRFGTIFGFVPGQHWRTIRPHLFLNSMILDAVVHGEIKVNSLAERPVTALHDAVTALVHQITTDQAPGQILNRYWCSATLLEWAEEVARAARAEGYPVTVGPVHGKPTDNRSYFCAPHVRNFPNNVLQETLRATVRYIATHRYALARWRKTQFKVLLGKVTS